MRLFIPVVLLLSLSAVACTTSWQTPAGPAPQVLAAHTGETVRVVRRSAPSVILHRVEVIGDSVIGDSGDPPQRTAIALSDVQMVTVRATDNSVANTGIKAVAVVVVALLAVTAIAIMEFDDLFDWN